MRRLLSVLTLFACLVCSTACLPQPLYPAWTIEDLRWLGPADAAAPAADLLAVYTRTTALTVDIRLDLLNIDPGDTYSLKVSLWDNRSFAVTPLEIRIASNGAVQASGGVGGKPVVWPRVLQDDALDTVTLSLNRALIGGRYRLDVSTYAADPTQPVDGAQGIRSDGLPPTRRASVLLAFRNAFPAVTPAQALRRWDGAHTGPLGDRHGLKHILDAAERYDLPVALLDLKTPASLAALQTMGSIPQIQRLAGQGLLILPDVAESQPVDVALAFGRRAAGGFGLPGSEFVYAPGAGMLPGYAARFTALPDSSHIAVDGATRLIPLPVASEQDAGEDGPSLAVRRALMAAALSSDPAALVALGGDLPASTWGDSDMTYPTFAWLAGHPWIHVLDAQALLVFPATAGYSLPPVSPPASPRMEALRQAPQNALTESAWLAYLSLTAAGADPKLEDLRSQYFGQVDELLAAARWAEHPVDQVDCAHDLNGDGQPECVLSDGSYFAILDPAGGRLSNLVYLNAAGPHQIVAPSSQFAVGLSDPSEWRPGQGEAADPGVIPGGFLDDGSWERLSFTTGDRQVEFHGADGGYTKTYRLTGDGLQVEYRGTAAIATRLPLVADPQRFYFAPTVYRSSLAPHSWTWKLAHGLTVRVHSEQADLDAQGFNVSLPFLAFPEDPNMDYPEGHYFPFPLSVMTIHGQGDFSLTLAAFPGK
jgi:hypothetical protein